MLTVIWFWPWFLLSCINCQCAQAQCRLGMRTGRALLLPGRVGRSHWSHRSHWSFGSPHCEHLYLQRAALGDVDPGQPNLSAGSGGPGHPWDDRFSTRVPFPEEIWVHHGSSPWAILGSSLFLRVWGMKVIGSRYQCIWGPQFLNFSNRNAEVDRHGNFTHPKKIDIFITKIIQPLGISLVSQDYWLRDLDQSPLQLQHEVLRFATGRVVQGAETPTRRLAAATKYIEVSLGW